MGDGSLSGRLRDHAPPRRVEIENGESAASKSRGNFDPVHDGFGFRNPIGIVPGRAGNPLFRRLDALLYGNGLCFGMAVAALREFSDASEGGLSSLRFSDDLLGSLLQLHARQYRPRAVFAVVFDWLRARGGRADGVPRRLRLPDDEDPHIICFGPALNRRFLYCMSRAHAVAPYRIERLQDETRVYVYDPNHPKSRERRVVFERDGGFEYGGFSTRGGWGISLIPLSALGGASIPALRLGPEEPPR